MPFPICSPVIFHSGENTVITTGVNDPLRASGVGPVRLGGSAGITATMHLLKSRWDVTPRPPLSWGLLWPQPRLFLLAPIYRFPLHCLRRPAVITA